MNELWFGTVQRMQWCPMPAKGVARRMVAATDSGTLAGGGGYGYRSSAEHSEFDFDFSWREAHGPNALDVFQEYRTGLWNDFATVVDGFNPNNLIYFLDPMNAEQNLFPAHWAAPVLQMQYGVPWIGNFASSAVTSANAFRQPQRTVTFNITHTAGTLQAETARRAVIPIPPGYTLRWGWSGSSTGTGAVRAEAHNASTGAIVGTNAAALSATASTRLSQSLNGDTYDYSTFGLTRTSAVTSTVTLASMMAVLHPNAESPALTGLHARGLGNSGCIFGDASETYEFVHEIDGRHVKALSFSLKDIGAWL